MNRMKDHEVRELINDVTNAVRIMCDGFPQSIRERLSKVIKKNDGIKRLRGKEDE